jgi:alpha-beta hydrolase superfamily lysophospholipase
MTVTNLHSVRARALLFGILATVCFAASAKAESVEHLTLRGKVQSLHIYGAPAGEPVVLSSGDGGWIHLAPQLGQLLAGRGFYVVGVDSKAYLESFTEGTSTLSEADVTRDYQALIAYATQPSHKRALLIGVSEGAGLSMLASLGPRSMIEGVIGLGLGDANELGWRWRDALIYVTHGVPNEPLFSARAIAGRIASLPFAVINSTHDEYVAQAEIDAIVAAAAEPKRLWMIDAADHRFSNQPVELARRLDEAVSWIRENRQR